MKIGFDNDKYLKMQSEHIRERIGKFGGKLYLEFGGKLFDDYHASRVLPGFEPDSKLRLLKELSDQAEIVFAISAKDIEKNKIRGDLGITYDSDVIRLIGTYREQGLFVGSVVITQFSGQESALLFKNRLENLGISVYIHYNIPGYPSNIPLIVSENGYGKNDYIETSHPLVIVTAPGPGSGKMNLPLKHPVNLAYEAATADLNDVNMIDPYHLEAYGVTTVNYNRDVEIFPVLNTIFEKIYGSSPYKSPTDMGVNMAGNCICDDEACREASRQEIIRRYYAALNALLKGDASEKEAEKIELLMNMEGITVSDRKVAVKALERAQQTGGPAAALELEDGRIITGKTSNLLGASAALLVNVLKELAGIDHNVHIISPEAIEPIQKLKVDYLNSKNPRLHTDEILIALSASAAVNPIAELALSQLPKLKGCQAHTSVMLSSVDIKTFKKLGVQLTSEAVNERQILS